MPRAPLELARALHAALEAGAHGDALRPHFTDDAVTVELPNLIKPDGATSPLDVMLRASTAGASLLASQRYEVHHAHEHGALAVVRLTWTGVLAQDAGPFRRGQVLTAHIAQFVETRDDRIARIETYDCYEPLQRGG